MTIAAQSQFATVAHNRPSGGPYRLCYELHGEGPNKVLLVMGLSGSLRMWDTTVRQLLARGGFEVCIFDNRDAGDSDKPGPGYSIQDMALDALELLHHLNWTRNVFVAGISMGGMITQELLLAAPEGTFASAVLISTHAGLTVPPLATIAVFSKLILWPWGRTETDIIEGFCKLVFHPSWLDGEAPVDSGYTTNREMMQQQLLRVGRQKGPQPDHSRRGQIWAVQRHYVSPARLRRIAQLQIPVLVMTGTDDLLIRPSNSHHLAHHLSCPLKEFPSAGHGLPQERPHQVHSLMVETFRKSAAYMSHTSTGGKLVAGEGHGRVEVNEEEVRRRVREADASVASAATL
ncbi:Alpha/Beta hydrolase protein [Fimicolochytrium jonesii]|uniref:Alpha/Beta hydrolase protein n=1 Tax=Fimicolochytrium jonesii TaxID=1396493 RepID=UPI0022FE0055|nr:Alpha/Beta hydrolase protein [Fimicolochytrium jonesii]KAI8819096.1 Alpha/Beta hydrolase protein [Fimicolochytrium jonesii]